METKKKKRKLSFTQKKHIILSKMKNLSEMLLNKKAYKKDVFIVYSDIVHSTKISLSLSSDMLFRGFLGFIGVHHKVIELALKNYRGILLNKWGDGLVFYSDESLNAIKAAFEILRFTGDEKIKDALGEHFTHDNIGLRIGIHKGSFYRLLPGWESGKENEDKKLLAEFLGTEISLTQRVQLCAKRNEICITDTVAADLLKKKLNEITIRKYVQIPTTDFYISTKRSWSKIRNELLDTKHKKHERSIPIPERVFVVQRKITIVSKYLSRVYKFRKKWPRDTLTKWKKELNSMGIKIMCKEIREIFKKTGRQMTNDIKKSKCKKPSRK
jgi:class 3 adenylate cyclase